MKVSRQKQFKKLPLIVAGIILVAFVGLAIYAQKLYTPQQQIVAKVTPIPTPYVLPQPDVDTSTWKTYTDPVLKYSIKYPADIVTLDPYSNTPGSLIEFIPNDLADALLNAKAEDRRSLLNMHTLLYINGSKGVDVGKDAFEEAYNGVVQSQGIGVARNVRRVNINNAYGGEYVVSPQYYSYEYLLTDKNKSGEVISIGIKRFKKSDTKNIEIFKQMIATFRFNRASLTNISPP